MTRVQSGWSGMAGVGCGPRWQVIGSSDFARSLRQTRRYSYRQKLGWDLPREFPVRNIHKGKREHETGWMKWECRAGARCCITAARMVGARC